MPSTTIGAGIGALLGAFGKKPKVPTLADVNPDLIQKDTVAGNIANFADIAKLATQTNTFNQEQLEALMDRALPGVREQIQSNISSMTRGEVPKDVSAAVTRYGAQRGLGALTTGSQFSNNLTARDLGLTSLNLIDKGLSSAESWLQRAQAPQMDVSAMFFSPQQRLQFAQQQQAIKFDRDVMAAGVRAAPDPWRAALAQGIDQDVARLENAALSYFGGGLGSATPKPMSDKQFDSAARSASFGGGGFGGGLGGFGF